MKILAFDTSTGWLSAALFDGQQALAIREHAGNGASERILPAIGELLAQDGSSLAGLDGIAYGAGPGSFTGVRIACGVAQGLAFGADLPLYAVSTLEAIAQGARRTHGWQRVVACLDARMREVYVAAYERDRNGWLCVREPTATGPEAVEAMTSADWHGAGDGFAAFPALAARLGMVECDHAIIPDAHSVAQCAWPRVRAGAGVPAEEARPLYVRHRVALTSVERAAGHRL